MGRGMEKNQRKREIQHRISEYVQKTETDAQMCCAALHYWGVETCDFTTLLYDVVSIQCPKHSFSRHAVT